MKIRSILSVQARLPFVVQRLGPALPQRISLAGSWRGALLGLFTLVLVPATARAQNFALGTTNLVESASAGLDSVVLGVFGAATNWAATADAPWLHINSPNDHGTGSTNVLFTFDPNPGPPRTGTLTIAGLTLVVNQAGANYVPADWIGGINYSAAFTNSPLLTELFSVGEVFVDGAGKTYWYNDYNETFNLGIPNDPSSTVLFSTQAIKGYYFSGFGVDGAGNIYFPNFTSNAIIRWAATDGSLAALPCPIAFNTNYWGFGVDAAGNCYFSGATGFTYKRKAGNGAIIPLFGTAVWWLAVDGSGSVFFRPSVASPQGLGYPPSAYKWSVTDGSRSVVFEAFDQLFNWGVVDPVGDIGLWGDSAMVLPRAFVDPTARTEWADAGGDRLPAVVPAAENLTGPFAPAGDQPWLTITGVTNGVVGYSFTANTTGASRTANVTVLGVTIPVTQLAVAAPVTTAPGSLPGGGFQFTFSGTLGAAYTVLSTTNLALPKGAWTVAGTAVESPAGQFKFTASPIPGGRQQFFQVHSP